MSTPDARSHRYVHVVRALVLASGLGGAGCAATASPPDVPGYMVVPSALGGYCVCCPSGDWSGQCYPNPMVGGDAGPGAPQTPPSGQHWCTGADLTREAGTTSGPQCPIAGPLPPPELAA